MINMNKTLTMKDILKFEASNSKKDKELQKQWEETIKKSCDFIDQCERSANEE